MSNNPTETVKDYQNYVDKKSPNSPILKNCFNLFNRANYNGSM